MKGVAALDGAGVAAVDSLGSSRCEDDEEENDGEDGLSGTSEHCEDG